MEGLLITFGLVAAAASYYFGWEAGKQEKVREIAKTIREHLNADAERSDFAHIFKIRGMGLYEIEPSWNTLSSGPPPAFIVRQSEFCSLAARSALALDIPLDAVETRGDSMHEMYL
ncbi:MAG: hypothetical protein LW923_11570, partial [Betaproteobacteria bacterium]|nr:hypothetical protein [Betaproteobacteria bacterium]